MRITSYWGAFA